MLSLETRVRKRKAPPCVGFHGMPMPTASNPVTTVVPQTTVTVAPKVPAPVLLLHKPVFEVTGLVQVTDTAKAAAACVAILGKLQAQSSKPKTIVLKSPELGVTVFDGIVVCKSN